MARRLGRSALGRRGGFGVRVSALRVRGCLRANCWSSVTNRSLGAVLSALRQTDSEVQLTRTLAAFAERDEHQGFATDLARAFLNAGSNPAAEQLAERLPESLQCHSEHFFKGLGRADLFFVNERERFALIVEAKLSATCQPGQLSQYCRALAGYPAESSGVVLVRRSSSTGPEELAVADDPRWRGGLRWVELLPGLRALEHPDSLASQTWKVLLDVLEDQGEFGLVKLDKEAIEGWGYLMAGRKQLRELVGEITGEALEIIRSELPATYGAEPAQRAELIQGRTEWEDHIFQRIAVPAAAAVERLWLTFVGGPPGVRFALDARTSDGESRPDLSDPVLLTASEALDPVSGWETGEYYGRYWSRPHPIEAWPDSAQGTIDALLDFVREDIREIVASGLLEALPAPIEADG